MEDKNKVDIEKLCELMNNNIELTKELKRGNLAVKYLSIAVLFIIIVLFIMIITAMGVA